MENVTRQDRERELEGLLARLREHPEQSLTEERKRVAVLQRTLAGHPADASAEAERRRVREGPPRSPLRRGEALLRRAAGTFQRAARFGSGPAGKLADQWLSLPALIQQSAGRTPKPAGGWGGAQFCVSPFRPSPVRSCRFPRAGRLASRPPAWENPARPLHWTACARRST